MSEYVLSCCSTVDLSADYMEERNIKYLSFHFEIDGVLYADDFGQSIALKEFYRKMKDGVTPRTSQINITEYEEFFESFLSEGKDVLHIAASSGFSGTYNSAMIAASDLREKYPDRKLYVVDSLAASAGCGLLVDKLADLRDAGQSIEEVRDWAEKNKLRCMHWVLPSDLTYLIRGGRVSKTVGMIGKALSICPLLYVDHNGKMNSREKCRGKKKAMRALVDKMKVQAENGLEYSGKCYISHSDCYEDASMVAEAIKAAFQKLSGGVRIFDIGTVVGCHTGPGTIALFFWGKPDLR